MDMTLLHPKIVHLPIALATLMPLITGGLALAWWRGWFQRRTWIIAVLLQATLVVGGFAALQTGEEDEEIVERVVSHKLIHEHEEAGEAFFLTSIGVLALFVAAGVVRSERVALPLAAVALAGTVAVLGLGVRVGAMGGELVYEHNAGSAFSKQGKGAPDKGEAPRGDHEDDDDDDDH